MLSGTHRKFCEGVVSGLNGAESYRAAYPNASGPAAEVGASRLLRNDKVVAEIERLRAKADDKAGSAVMTLAEKRKFLARVVRASVGTIEEDSDLLQSIKRTEHGTEYRLPDKIAAVKLDNDLAGEGSEAEANDALAGLLERCMK